MRVVAFRHVGDPRKVEGHVLQGGVPHAPGLLCVEEIELVQLEAQAAALRYLRRIAPVEDEVRVPLVGGDVGDVVQELLVPLGLEEFLRNVNEGFREEEGPSRAVALLEDLEELPDEPLRFFFVFPVGLAGKGPTRSDGRNVYEVLRNLPVEVDVGKDRLAASWPPPAGKTRI